MRRLIKRIICAYSGHILGDGAEFRCYIRDGRRFKHNGRLFRCKRCGAFVYIKGIRDKELVELITATLESLPKINLDYPGCSYSTVNKMFRSK